MSGLVPVVPVPLPMLPVVPALGEVEVLGAALGEFGVVSGVVEGELGFTSGELPG